MAKPGVEVEGLKEFNKALKKVSKDLSKDMRGEMRSEVADPVAAKIKARVPVKSGRWKKAIRGGATTKTAYVQWGKATVPYAPWMEFGGAIRPHVGQAIIRPYMKDGRYVYPTLWEERGRANEAAMNVLERSMKRAQLQLS